MDSAIRHYCPFRADTDRYWVTFYRSAMKHPHSGASVRTAITAEAHPGGPRSSHPVGADGRPLALWPPPEATHHDLGLVTRSCAYVHLPRDDARKCPGVPGPAGVTGNSGLCCAEDGPPDRL